jgi:hypothetical protein
MMPSSMMLLEKLPLTGNGKVDRRGLPSPERGREELSAYVEPRSGVESELARIWGEVLHREKVGIDDDFFALGGHSLLATQVVSRVRSVFEVELPLRKMFEHPTIAQLALAVIGIQSEQKNSGSKRISRISRDDSEDLLTNIDHLSDEEVDLLLNRIEAETEVAL